MVTTLDATLMRGGTSKALFFRAGVLPEDADALRGTLLRVMGSPDQRQIDGIGGGDATTSKVAVVERSADPAIDLDYTFIQVSVVDPTIDLRGNCGNISAAVAPFAALEGLLDEDAASGQRPVVIRNTNTDSLLRAWMPRPDAPLEEDPGVPGRHRLLELDYRETVASSTGSVLPTGNAVETVNVPSSGAVAVSIVDAANIVAYVRGEHLGFHFGDPYDDVKTSLLEEIRGAVAERLGLVGRAEDARRTSPMFPLVSVLFDPPTSQGALDENRIGAEMQVLRHLHPTYAGTGIANLGAASALEGTLVADLLSRREDRRHHAREIVITHPGGENRVTVAGTLPAGLGNLQQLSYKKSYRALMRGAVFV